MSLGALTQRPLSTSSVLEYLHCLKVGWVRTQKSLGSDCFNVWVPILCSVGAPCFLPEFQWSESSVATSLNHTVPIAIFGMYLQCLSPGPVVEQLSKVTWFCAASWAVKAPKDTPWRLHEELHEESTKIP